MKWMTWPVPALLAWGTCWLCFALLRSVEAPEWLALLLATLWGATLTTLVHTPMRRALVLLGFPLSMLASSSAFQMPALGWLALLALMAWVYPSSAWRDAPLFPTPRQALQALPAHVRMPDGANILDAGSGLGDGLIALSQAYPNARLDGLEMSWPLRLLSAARCPFARIRQGDIWAANWHPYDMVYMFQRPESMPRAVEKAQAELAPGAWLVSLEFEARELQAQATYLGDDGRPVWAYQQPFSRKV